eukprot:1227-Amphidinium_carterae.1
MLATHFSLIDPCAARTSFAVTGVLLAFEVTCRSGASPSVGSSKMNCSSRVLPTVSVVPLGRR